MRHFSRERFGFKPCCLGLDTVATGYETFYAKLTAVVGRGVTDDLSGRVGGDNGCAGNHRARGVGDGAGQRRICGCCGTKAHFKGRSLIAGGNTRGQSDCDCAAFPWRGNGLPVSALVITQEEMVISVNGKPLIAVGSHREDGEATWQRIWCGKNSLNAIESPAVHRSGGARSGCSKPAARRSRLCRSRCWAFENTTQDSAHDPACPAASRSLSRFRRRRRLRCGGNSLLLFGTLGKRRLTASLVASGFRRRALDQRSCGFTRISYLRRHRFLVNPPFAISNKENHQDKSGKRGNPRPCEMPAGEPTMANSGFQNQRRIGRWKRKRNNLPAGRTIGKMRECRLLLMRGQSVLDKGVELVRVWMLPGLKSFAHSCPEGIAAFATVCSENAVICELCNKARRLISRSRGSLPSASSAARLLNPPACRCFSSRLRRSVSRRLSRRLIVASCTWRTRPIWPSGWPSRK